MSVPERGGRCLAAPASPDPVVKAEREAAWHGRQKAESGSDRAGEGTRRAGGESGDPRPGPAARPQPRGGARGQDGAGSPGRGRRSPGDSGAFRPVSPSAGAG